MLLTAEIDSIKKDLEITERVLLTALPLFNKEVARVSASKLKSGPKKDPTKDPAPAPVSDSKSKQKVENQNNNTTVEKAVHKNLDPNQKSLYKKIASQTHPDKMRRAGHYEKKYKNNLFETAREAMEQNDYHSICKIAEKLEIELPKPTPANVDSLTRTRDKVSEKVNRLRRSLPWSWYLESNIKKKNEMVLRYVENITENS